uniref:Uncharacterized protein n=1 Tax=Megaselia scalaris TaxID=36166 RepID=T1GHH4_MEGSC
MNQIEWSVVHLIVVNAGTRLQSGCSRRYLSSISLIEKYFVEKKRAFFSNSIEQFYVKTQEHHPKATSNTTKAIQISSPS